MSRTTVLLFILAVAILLRFYRLGEVPIGLHRDEAFLGYNAYSILKTGKDITADFLPFHFRSFLNSPALYAYLSLPFIQLFDLHAFSVRFPAALFGSLTILVTYFLARTLLKQTMVALLACGLLAISPWHINLSRTATENIVVVFFFSLGTLLYLLWLRKHRSSLLLFASACFGITFLIYQASRAFLPLFIPLLILVFLGTKMDKKRVTAVVVLSLVTVFLPLLLILSSHRLSLRIRTVSIFATAFTQLTIDEQIREDGVSHVAPTIARVFHNKLTGYTTQFVKNYFAHFSFDFLFTDRGLPSRYRVPNVGLLYAFELPLLLLGIWTLLSKRKKEGTLLVSWLLLAPIGSALTFDDVPNLQRTVIVFPALSMVVATGGYELFFFLKKQKKIVFYTSLIASIVFAVYNTAFYLHQYYIHERLHQPWHRHEGYKELVQKVNAILPQYKKAIITNSESGPAIFFLFYSQYDPKMFQNETKNARTQDFDRVNFAKYEFSEEECPLTIGTEDSMTSEERKALLFVNHGVCPMTQAQHLRVVEDIARSDGSVVFRILRFER